MTTALLVAQVSPSSPDSEPAFNHWYDTVHIPQCVERIPGIVGGKRYLLSDAQMLAPENLPTRRYLSIYEIETDDLAGTIERLGVALGDGSLDLTDAIDMGDRGPLMHFYSPVPAA